MIHKNSEILRFWKSMYIMSIYKSSVTLLTILIIVKQSLKNHKNSIYEVITLKTHFKFLV